MESSQLRFRILQALLDWERSGDSRLPEAGQLAKRLSVGVDEIVDQFDILETEGAVIVQRAFGDRSSDTTAITGGGKRMAQEMLQHQTQSTVGLPISETTIQALDLLDQVIAELCTRDSNIVGSIQKCLHAIRLLGWDEGWLFKELNGYSDDEQPPWRTATCTAVWVNPKGQVVKEYVADFYLPQSLSNLNHCRKVGFAFPTGRSKKINGILHTEHVNVKPLLIETVLNTISTKLFNYASKAAVTSRFGQIVATAFQQYQESVNNMLIQLGIDNYLKVAYQNLAQDNEASWQAAVLACRNIMHKLSETLWQSSEEIYPYMKAKNGSPMRVTRNEPRNRIRAYLHQKGLASDDMIVKMIDPLYSIASSGKSSISYEHAQRVIVYTYIFLGEMTKLTDMQPLTELRKI